MLAYRIKHKNKLVCFSASKTKANVVVKNMIYENTGFVITDFKITPFSIPRKKADLIEFLNNAIRE